MLYEYSCPRFYYENYYEEIIEIASHYGYISYQKLIFNTIKDRDECLKDLEDKFLILKN